MESLFIKRQEVGCNERSEFHQILKKRCIKAFMRMPRCENKV